MVQFRVAVFARQDVDSRGCAREDARFVLGRSGCDLVERRQHMAGHHVVEHVDGVGRTMRAYAEKVVSLPFVRVVGFDEDHVDESVEIGGDGGGEIVG